MLSKHLGNTEAPKTQHLLLPPAVREIWSPSLASSVSRWREKDLESGSLVFSRAMDSRGTAVGSPLSGDGGMRITVLGTGPVISKWGQQTTREERRQGRALSPAHSRPWLNNSKLATGHPTVRAPRLEHVGSPQCLLLGYKSS